MKPEDLSHKSPAEITALFCDYYNEVDKIFNDFRYNPKQVKDNELLMKYIACARKTLQTIQWD